MDLFKTMYSMTIASVALLLLAVLSLASYTLQAAELNKQLPAPSPSSGSLAPVNIDLPSQPLDASLKQLARSTGMSVAFDSKLASGKTAPAIKGRMKADEALKMLLAGSGLESSIDKDNAVIKPAAEKETIDFKVDTVEVRAKRFYEIGPLPGLGLSKEEIPGNVQSITGKQIRDSHSISLSDLMNSQLQSVNVNDYQGNPFQMDVTYRGFTASPQIGTPQGLSVFLDGIRVNEPFGDVVNWDMIPMNALAGLDLFPGSNPIFGLNTLGGALAMRTKNGFDDAGVTTDVLAGAFGRKQFLLSAGGSHGSVGGYVALNLFDEEGWRDNSPSRVNQIFSKLSYRGDRLSLDGSMLYAGNDLVGNGLVPIEMFKQDASSVFSSPDKTKNELMQFQIASAFQVNERFSITGQIYNRRSDRNAITGDINRGFATSSARATRQARAGENPVCAFASTNAYGIPNYYVVSEAFGDGSGAGISVVAEGLANGRYTDFAGAVAAGDIDLSTLNMTLPPEALELITNGRSIEANMFHGRNGRSPGLDYSSTTENDNGVPIVTYATPRNSGVTWAGLNNGDAMYYWTDADTSNGTIVHFLVAAPAINGTCGTDSVNSADSQLSDGKIFVLDANGNRIYRDGRLGNSSGYIDGTPTAIISETEIGQRTKGGAVQLNWQFDQHKFMVGASLDHANSTYNNAQMLGLLNASRHAYLDPANIGPEFTAASIPVRNNDFTGLSNTRSVYMSETYSPQDNLHVTFGARYNYTKVITNMSTRRNTSLVDLMDYEGSYMDYLLCTGMGLDSCDQHLLNNPTPNPLLGNSSDGYFNPTERESFTYHKLNPSLGATWSPTNTLNLYTNWSQGTRTPSAIELGCAFDDTPTYVNSTGGTYTTPQPRSLVNGTSCTLPTSLSGDPYLPQVVSRTFEIGARGNLTPSLKWNASVFRSNLTDDIYFVGYTAEKSFFDTVGRTRREGVEMGISGNYGKFDFKLNYSLVSATFESQFKMANADNSSVNHNPQRPDHDMQTVNPGNRMPGIPLHNLNATLGYQVTDKWRVGLTMIAHGNSYARGNENNQHEPTTITYTVTTTNPSLPSYDVTKRYTHSGKTPGYAILNFNTSYNIGKGWSASLVVNNILDKEYYSASRLGINPFSPSIQGAIGASGWNYNSNDWNSTALVAPGAPRAAWVSLRYDFNADDR